MAEVWGLADGSWSAKALAERPALDERLVHQPHRVIEPGAVDEPRDAERRGGEAVDGDAVGRERGRATAHVVERRVDAGADDAQRAERVGDAHGRAERLLQRLPHARFLVQVLARD